MINITNVSAGDTVQFITKVDNSKKGQEVQHVILKITDITSTCIKGVNAIRALDLNDDRKPFRSYKIVNIVPETLWKLVG